MSRRHDGTALLIAGYGETGAPALEASTIHMLGQVGEALLATGATWQIRRLATTAGERYGVDRASVKRHLDELVVEPVRVAVLVVLGTIIEVAGELALVTGPDARAYPEESTLPLSWIRQRLEKVHAEQVVVVVSARGDASPQAWFDLLATRRAQHLIAVDTAPPGRAPLADALLAGLCGEALDSRTGTVTMASLGTYLTERAPDGILQRCDASETIAQPPPLAGLWDVRRSQLSVRGTRPRHPHTRRTDDDLTGSVLPGRFRIDSLVARGTFGTIYRARQLAVERDVALKVLHAEIDPSSEDGRLFVHEIRSVGRIDHANVVRIFQADMTHDGRLFFAMELLDGRDLATVISDGRVPRDRAIELVRQLLEGLGAAHDAGLVHADVKPANAILVERDGTERVVLVDFGLSRLRSPDRPAESAGGTPAYMAPEQMMEGRVDARSDLFSAALVLVHLLTGWRRPNASTLTPPPELIPDDLRSVLDQALALDPAQRFATAREFAAALTGTKLAPVGDDAAIPQRPFRHLEPLTEDDRGRLHGRQVDLAQLVDHVLYRRSVIYTAPSGVGKTSLLRAGLIPRLEALRIRPVYVRCRSDSPSAIADAIHDGATTIREAIAAHAAAGGGKLVLILDQLERALAEPNATALIHAVLDATGSDVCAVLGIREDHLARLLARTQESDPQIAIVRLPPLSPEGATEAIVQPLTESRLAIEPDLLAALLTDLQSAAATIGAAMGWGATPAVYPPHLQLACTALYDALPTGEVTLTLAHYKQLGGFEAIVGEHLERVLDNELADGRDVIARDLFVELVTSTHERAVRTENELVAIASARNTPREIRAVLEALRTRGLLVRTRDPQGDPAWELVHDSLVPRVLAWIDRKDLARRRAIELVRYHVRRSRPEAPSLLGRAELRELSPYMSALADLDVEHRAREPEPTAWTPSKLVARSRRVQRRRNLVLTSLIGALFGVSTLTYIIKQRESERRTREAFQRARDLGRIRVHITQFDWDPLAGTTTPAPLDPALAWTLRLPTRSEPVDIGDVPAPELFVRGARQRTATELVEEAEAHGGRAFIIVERGACAPSVVPVAALPGYAQRDTVRDLAIAIPTCAATLADTIVLPRAPFIHGGPGEPPARAVLEEGGVPEVQLELPTFRMDRVEVTNAAFDVFARLQPLTGIVRSPWPSTRPLAGGDGAKRPVVAVDWPTARNYCRYLGKDLPTSPQWSRALRGPLTLDGVANPTPRRNFPWGLQTVSDVAYLRPGADGSSDVGSRTDDRSIEGVRDLAGNVQEWTLTLADAPHFRASRGGNFLETEFGNADFTAIDNVRAVTLQHYGHGMRCVINAAE